jgi:N-glycosylase/DNA lyase
MKTTKILKNDLNLKSTLLSGQCFRVTEESDNSFTCILKDRIINIIEEDKYLKVKSNMEDNLENIIKDYFDLNTDYNLYENELSKDKYMEGIINKCKGYKILKQDPFEMFFSYIISQNNRVSRISKSIEKISIMFGKKVLFNNKEYYLFPTLEELKNASLDDLTQTGIGFRNKYVLENIKFLTENPDFLNKLKEMETEDALKELIDLKGIGLKVASCILLFSYHRFDVFPIDTWVIKNISENNKNIKANQKEISTFAKKQYGKLSGLAIQYMFHYERNEKNLKI